MKIHRLAFLLCGVALCAVGFWLPHGIVDHVLLLAGGLCLSMHMILCSEGKDYLP